MHFWDSSCLVRCVCAILILNIFAQSGHYFLTKKSSFQIDNIIFCDFCRSERIIWESLSVFAETLFSRFQTITRIKFFIWKGVSAEDLVGSFLYGLILAWLCTFNNFTQFLRLIIIELFLLISMIMCLFSARCAVREAFWNGCARKKSEGKWVEIAREEEEQEANELEGSLEWECRKCRGGQTVRGWGRVVRVGVWTRRNELPEGRLREDGEAGNDPKELLQR